MGKLTGAHLEELDHEGFVVVPNFITGDKLKNLQAAQRREVPTYDQIKDDLPLEGSGYSFMSWFPYEELELLSATMDEESIAFARKWLKTDDIHARVGRRNRTLSGPYTRRYRLLRLEPAHRQWQLEEQYPGWDSDEYRREMV